MKCKEIEEKKDSCEMYVATKKKTMLREVETGFCDEIRKWNEGTTKMLMVKHFAMEKEVDKVGRGWTS